VQLSAHDWCIYLDEESMVDAAFLAGIYQYILRVSPPGRTTSRQRPCPIGQGAILYQGDNWFFQGADALRTADDLGRFRLQYALGVPLFGIHGSYIVVRSIEDAALSFDVGARNSLTEDAAWSLRAWARGHRFAWVSGTLYEQPPQTALDFVRQRARWLAGIRRVLRDRAVPVRFRLGLGLFTALWQLSFLPFLVAIAALLVHIAPFPWMRLAADFAWACYVLAYLQGVDRSVARRRRSAYASAVARNSTNRWQRGARTLGRSLVRVAAWALALCYIWYALLEAGGVLWSLVPKGGFFVIRKRGHLAARERSSTPQPVRLIGRTEGSQA
jgi:egghead protein (zeste-white 4 protein)